MLEYSQNYFNKTGSLWFYLKDEITNFNADIGKNNVFDSFKCIVKLLPHTVAQPTPSNNDEILKNETFVAPLKNLSNIQRSLEMPLINCKVELKLKWVNYCVLVVDGNDNTNAHPNNIIFTIKVTKLYVPAVNLSAKFNQMLSEILSKGSER